MRGNGMGNISNIFKSFYSQYDSDVIRRAYGKLNVQMEFLELYKKIPFSVEIRMKNGVFAMQLNTENVLSMELMTVIGFFFDRYSEEKNCVWTKSEKKVKRFFRSGISEFVSFGGVVKLNLSENDIGKIVSELENDNANPKMHKKLVENFNLLENKNWDEYEKYITDIIKKEENDRHIENVTCMDLPLDWTNAFSTDERATDVSAKTPADGLILSLNNLGKVDIEYISQITGVSCKEVISALKGSIYQNPDTWEECFYKGWETADEYLSGRVGCKLKKAKKENQKYNGYFDENVSALERVMPKRISAEDIHITLGSPWVPSDVIDDFITHLFGKPEENDSPVEYDAFSGIWYIPSKNRYSGRPIAEKTYGTKRINAFHILEKTLNMKTICVTDEVSSKTSKSGKKRVINKTETLLALEKQKIMIEKFKEWVWQNPERKERLQKIYDEKYGKSVIRHYDGSFLTFPQMNPSEKLYDYQKNAVARMIFSSNTLLAHEVGSGKTYEMIAAGMEMRRIGISKKNLYVVPNTLVGQWKKVFLKLYPAANILCVEPNTFKKDKRQSVLADIRDNDYDAIIIAYSSYELIPVSKEYYKSELELQKKQLRKVMDNTPKAIASQYTELNKLTVSIRELENTINDTYDIIYFDDLKINTMFVDEAHNFKNVPIKTKINNILGVSSGGSEKCRAMLDKVRIVQKTNNGRGIVFATGTPISNSLTDIFVMQKYLQNGALSLLGLQNFDSWVGMFAEKSAEVEIDVDASNFRMAERFTKFHNMPELSSLLAEVTDFHQTDTLNGIPEMSGYKDVVVAKTREFSDYINEISERTEDIRNGFVSPTDDNMLKITTDGRKAALDMRLVDSGVNFTYQCKAALCAENVFDIYYKTAAEKLTQLIFCDSSTPKNSFNMYDELKRLLMSMGIDEKQIAYIHDADSEKKREELFEAVRKGKIRILIGSTFKLGLGVNVQDKLIALHHLDVPWRPSDMIQREGRILRKGNTNSSVDIYRYIAEGSFDAYSWQILESKQRMISAILSGCVTQRMCEEIADGVLNYAEVKAISLGNPLLKKRVEVANELTRNLTLRNRMLEVRQELEAELAQMPNKTEYLQMRIENCREDTEFCRKNKFCCDKTERKRLRKEILNALIDNELSTNEITICNYRGFDVIIPTNMTKEKPYVYLQRNGKYRVDMGLAESGMLVRIDNFLDNLTDYFEELNDDMVNLNIRKNEIISELNNKNDYVDVIEKLRKELKKIDEKLGVKKQ